MILFANCYNILYNVYFILIKTPFYCTIYKILKHKQIIYTAGTD